MKPTLINKNSIMKIISEFKNDKKQVIKIDNTNYFNIVVICLIIILILFLIFRYIDKKNRSNNYNK